MKLRFGHGRNVMSAFGQNIRCNELRVPRVRPVVVSLDQALPDTAEPGHGHREYTLYPWSQARDERESARQAAADGPAE